MSKNKIGLILTALSISSAALAAPEKLVPDSSFYIGLGGSYNSTTINQDLYGFGVADYYQHNIKIASGYAGGPAATFKDSNRSFSPAVQLGYFKHVFNSDYMLGGRISYQHLDTSITNKTVDLPQYGNYTTVVQPTPPQALIGEAVFGSVTTNVKHSITFTPMIGHSFENSYIYFGAGATLNQISTDLNNGVGFADMKGHHTDVTGMPISLSNKKWVWGNALRIGATYFIDKSWAIDANYSYSTVKNTFKNRAYFSYQGNVGYADTSSTQRLTNQGIMFSINKHF